MCMLHALINPQCACAARVTVLVLSVSVPTLGTSLECAESIYVKNHGWVSTLCVEARQGARAKVRPRATLCICTAHA